MVECDDTIADIKAAIQEKEGIRFHKQRLIYAGKQLENDHSFRDYNICYDSQIDLVLRMCGC
ncbi:hypothetical protein KY290_008975 [Solanum tuberosum]|uniref:Ubiquitin-like domain-containing protein n=1 Tax=Solanum tuberosum TaxID=4113 RepID=A0ABQ7WA39_SOLTU|nr:hypothetical protein KY289_009337 [Solanum tuberosum]KAH0745132.1 hypothetical protein KY285_006789 [Solanum tuberosum]KAH0777564.1 hypothetical protein KY290_008975 [Solanum tuberosum]